MEEWKEYKLGEVCKSIADGDHMPPPKTDKGIPFVTISNIVGNRLDFANTHFVPQSYYDDLDDKRRPHIGDTIYSVVGTFGKPVYVNEEKPFVFQRHIAILRPDNSMIVPQFLFYTLLSPQFYRKADVMAIGAVQRTISLTSLRNVTIQLPPLDIQSKIVGMLSSLDNKIEVNRRINENLEQQAQALFKSWLEGCQDEVSIGDLSLNITDYSKCNHDQVVLINSSDVTEGFFDHHILSPNKDLKGHFKKRFKKGDILYSQVRPRNRHWGYCTFDADNYLASTQLMVIRNKEELIPSILLYQYIIDDKVWMDFTLKTETRSGTFPQGNYEDLSSIRVPYSSDVDSISKELNSLYSMIYNNEQESRRLAELRDALLPRLMSGELKVNDLENNEI